MAKVVSELNSYDMFTAFHSFSTFPIKMNPCLSMKSMSSRFLLAFCLLAILGPDLVGQANFNREASNKATVIADPLSAPMRMIADSLPTVQLAQGFRRTQLDLKNVFDGFDNGLLLYSLDKLYEESIRTEIVGHHLIIHEKGVGINGISITATDGLGRSTSLTITIAVSRRPLFQVSKFESELPDCSNPFNEVVISALSEVFSVDIYDIQGNKYNYQVTIDGGKSRINFPGSSFGEFLVKLTTRNGVVFRKVTREAT